MTKNNPTSIAILGFGKLGTVLAQLARRAGHEVFVSGSGDPSQIGLSVSVIAPGAIALEASDAISKADLVILALPLSKYKSLNPAWFKNKLVIDAMNYWWEVDGDEAALLGDHASSSELIQAYLSSARIVKALSHMGYHHLLDEAKPHGDPHRKAIAVAGNSKADREAVALLVDSLGFEPLDIGSLSHGKYLEPGHPAFGAHLPLAELKKVIST